MIDPETGRSAEYERYLASPEWAERRAELIGVTGDWCKWCGRPGPSEWCGRHALDAHHLTYARFGQESIHDLALLCRPCHDEVHRLKRAFTIKKSAPRTSRGVSVEDQLWELL